MATVRIWVGDALVSEIPVGLGVTLEDRDLWQVATLEWPSGQVTPLVTDSGEPMIISDYEAPFF